MKRKIEFPKNMLWGTATSSYQIEGARYADGKSDSIWDLFTEKEGVINDGSSGDTACDHYNRYKEDIALMKKLHISSYRFSISWARVIPDESGRINQAGLDFYSRLVDELLKNNIRPFITLFHWDLPQWVEEKGGWLNRASAEYFAQYTRAVTETLGDRVTLWTTLNEPLSVITAGYISGDHAPGYKSIPKGFTAAHNLLRAHGKAVRVIRETIPDASIGIALNLFPIIPERKKDQSLAQKIDTFVNSFFLDPILKGHYPKPFWPLLHLVMKKPRKEDLVDIHQPIDFIGVNHYTRMLVSRKLLPSFKLSIEEFPELSKHHTELGFEIVPDSFYDTLLWLKNNYDNPPVYVTENGAAFRDKVRNGTVNDTRRVRYLEEYLIRLRNALDAGCDIRGYFVWSLLDNFEWAYGYTTRFGLVYVDFETQERIIKKSGYWFANLCKKKYYTVDSHIDMEP